MKDNPSTHDEPLTEEKTIQQLKDGFEKMDQWNLVEPPNLKWFQTQVEAKKEQIRQKRRKDLFTFICLAVFVLIILFTIVYREPIVFLYTQVVGLLLLPFAIVMNRKKVSSE